MRRSSNLDHFRNKAVNEGIKMAHVEGVIKQAVRRPLPGELLKRMAGDKSSVDKAELSLENNDRVHAVY